MRVRIAILLLGLAYPAWLAMLTLHEFGHVLHAWLSGGRVQRVTVPLSGFSFTELSSNPHPAFVAWGGFVWGCAIPLLAPAISRILRARRTTTRGLQVFAGFCLIANGTYLAIGQFDGVGDAGDLLRGGVPRWVLVVVGSMAAAGGLLLWHIVGRSSRSSSSA